MADRGNQQPKAEDTTANPPPDGAAPGAVGNLILLIIGVLLLAAWQAYDGFKSPESRSTHLLKAVLFLLYGAIRLGPQTEAGGPLDSRLFPCGRGGGLRWAQLVEGVIRRHRTNWH